MVGLIVRLKIWHTDLVEKIGWIIECVNSNSCLVRWFLRKYPGNTGCSPPEKEAYEHPIGKETKYTRSTRM